jgi:GNAT superfamily N-acetyltransferase
MSQVEVARESAEPLIRFAEVTDFEDVRRHYGMVQNAHATHMPKTFRPMEAWDLTIEQFYGFFDNPWLLLVAELDGAVAGSLLGSVQAEDGHAGYLPARTLHVWHVLTEPGLRRRGIARALIAGAAEWGARQRADRLDLAVWSFNTDALAFYRKLGFEMAYTGMTITPSEALARHGSGRLPASPNDAAVKATWQWPKWLRWR